VSRYVEPLSTRVWGEGSRLLRTWASSKRADEKKRPCMLSATVWFTGVKHDVTAARTLGKALRFECRAKTERARQAQYK
jgi:hypothetical protein